MFTQNKKFTQKYVKINWHTVFCHLPPVTKLHQRPLVLSQPRVGCNCGLPEPPPPLLWAYSSAPGHRPPTGSSFCPTGLRPASMTQPCHTQLPTWLVLRPTLAQSKYFHTSQNSEIRVPNRTLCFIPIWQIPYWFWSCLLFPQYPHPQGPHSTVRPSPQPPLRWPPHFLLPEKTSPPSRTAARKLGMTFDNFFFKAVSSYWVTYSSHFKLLVKGERN